LSVIPYSSGRGFAAIFAVAFLPVFAVAFLALFAVAFLFVFAAFLVVIPEGDLLLQLF
jgi:hypothetical protein